MALFQSDYDKGIKVVPSADDSDLLSLRVEFAATAAATGDIFACLPIPEEHVLVDVILDADDLDTVTGITLSVAYLNAGKTDIDVTNNVNGDGAAFIVASTVAQAGGIARPTTKSLWRALPRAATPSGTTPTGAQLKNLGIKVVAGATGFQAGELGLTAIYRAASFGG